MMSSRDTRMTMAVLPRWLQPLLTWLTGKPLPGQRPLFLWNAWTRLVPNLLQLAVGLGLAAWLLSMPIWIWLFLPIAWLLAAGGFRGLYLELAHNAVHHAFARNPRIDRAVTEVLTTLTLTPGYDEFRRTHVIHHHGATGTPLDPDYAALLSWGFVPGTDEATLRRRARRSWFNPALHASYLRARIRGNFLAGPRSRRLLAAAWHLSVLSAVASTGTWVWFGLGYLVPLTWGYQMSSVLQMLGGEHRWGQNVGVGRQRIEGLTYGRMLGEAYPHLGTRIDRLRWWVRLIGYHLPAKLFVFVGNDIGPAHDLHHRKPLSDWANAVYAREAMIRAGSFGPHVDVWGSIGEHVRYSLRGMAKGAPPAAE